MRGGRIADTMIDAFSLKHDVAIVTGGSRGIGEEIAVALAASGADVAVVARSEKALSDTVKRIEETGSKAMAYPLDVTDEADVNAMFDDIEAKLGPVDILINNAGTNPYFGDAKDLETKTWDKILSVNVTGPLFCARAFAQQIGERNGTGTIINVTSVGGVVGLPRQSPYSTAKHALVGLTKSLAVDWAPDIRVNAIAPGYVKTSMTERLRKNDNVRENILSTIPQGRFSDPEEIAEVAVYLASDASSYVTGEVHVVDGGLTAQHSKHPP